MSEYSKTAADFGNEYLASVANAQEQFLKSLSPFSQWTSSAPTPAFAVNLPTMKDIVDSNFAFANKLLAQQKAFVEKMLTATAPAA